MPSVAGFPGARAGPTPGAAAIARARCAGLLLRFGSSRGSDRAQRNTGLFGRLRHRTG
jgi:hypothetical protein